LRACWIELAAQKQEHSALQSHGGTANMHHGSHQIIIAGGSESKAGRYAVILVKIPWHPAPNSFLHLNQATSSMRPILPFLLHILITLVSLAALPNASAAEARPQPVGMQAAHFEDATRRNWSDSGARPLETLIWYPAMAGTAETEWEVAIFKAGKNARGAVMVASPAKLPLIVLSHGTGGSAVGLAWLGETLAANGYIVAAVNHHGNTGAEAEPKLQGTMIWWDRPQDLSRLIDRLLADPKWGARIDATRIGVAGFSIGGYTALASVGARLSRAQWRKFCTDAATAASCKLPPEISGKFPEGEAERLWTQDARMQAALAHMDDDYRDPRIKAAFAIAPVAGVAMQRDSLATITTPVQIVVGSEDDQAAPGLNAEPMAQRIPNAKLAILPKVTHYSFLPVCNDKGKNYVKELCTDPAGVERALLHQQVAARALELFNTALQAAPIEATRH
jgi:predicted dienelactone hydrolase